VSVLQASAQRDNRGERRLNDKPQIQRAPRAGDEVLPSARNHVGHGRHIAANKFTGCCATRLLDFKAYTPHTATKTSKACGCSLLRMAASNSLPPAPHLVTCEAFQCFSLHGIVDLPGLLVVGPFVGEFAASGCLL